MKTAHHKSMATLLALAGIFAVHVTAAPVTTVAQNQTASNGADIRLSLTVEDPLIAGINQQWGSVLVEIFDTTDLNVFDVSVLELDNNQDDVVYIQQFQATDLVFNGTTQFWELGIPLLFDPATFQDEAGDDVFLMNAYVNYGFVNGSDSQDTTNNPLQITVSAVPVPAAAWLFGSGLIGIAGVARRRQAAGHPPGSRVRAA